MSGFNPIPLNEPLSRVSRYAYGILLLTSAHHAYGAYIYASPWRLHVVALAAAAAILIGASAGLYRRYGGAVRTIALWLFAAAAFVFPFAMIGFFEGGYNHALKNALYFGGASPELLQRLFPAPTYELPDSVIFELTGIAQLLLAVPGAIHLYTLVSESPGDPAASEAPAVGPRQHSWR